MKPLVLFSFSLTFLTQGFADEFSVVEPSKQISAEEQNSHLANKENSQASMPSQSEDSPEWCLSPYHEMHASIRHNEAKGIGYKDGYTTLEVFGIYDGYGSGFMPFGDFRGHVFNDGKLAGNLGIGERTFLTSINHTFGSYLYYDVRRVGHGLTVNQLSPGIELVGERMEYRINGYFPLGKQKGRKYGYAFDEFKGHSILLKYKQQQAMTGGDAEVGVHIPQNTTYDIYAAAGPYYFKSSNAQSWGGRARLLGRYKEYVSFEVAYSYDKLFRSVVQGSIALTVPFGGKLKRCGPCYGKGCPQTDNLLLSRAAFAPSRFEIPVVKKVHKQEKAIDPATGQPWNVWFVNNTSHSLGSFESPFPTLAQAQNASGPNDIIYIYSGDGTSNGMDQGIVLQDSQKLFGASIVQTIPTTKGNFQIPAMSSQLPILTNVAGSGTVILLANRTEVSGLDIRASVSSSTLINTPSNLVNGGSIHDNTISGTISHTGISIVGTGTFFIQNNTFLDLSGSSFDCIQLTVNSDFLTTFLTNNSITGYDFGIRAIANSGGSGDFEISNNTITIESVGFGSAIFMSGTAGKTITTRIVNNQLTMLNHPGIIVAGNAGLCITGQIEDNVINRTGTGDDVMLSNSGAGNQISFSINNNQFLQIAAGHFGVHAIGAASATMCLDMSNNISSTGYNFDNSAGGTFYLAPFVNNTGTVTKTGVFTPVAPGGCPTCN